MQRRLFILTVLLAVSCCVAAAEEKKPAAAEPKLVSEEEIHETVTKQTYSDGTIKMDVKGRSRDNPMTFVPSPQPANPEPEPTEADRKRGYLLLAPASRGGVLPEYRPAPDEIGREVKIWASPGEFEPATFCVRPLRDLGEVRFEVGELKNKAGKVLAGAQIDLYVVEPTVEQIKLTDTNCRWVAKWLAPVGRRRGQAGRNIQVVLDVRIPDDAAAGAYSVPIKVGAE